MKDSSNTHRITIKITQNISSKFRSWLDFLNFAWFGHLLSNWNAIKHIYHRLEVLIRDMSLHLHTACETTMSLQTQWLKINLLCLLERQQTFFLSMRLDALFIEIDNWLALA